MDELAYVLGMDPVELRLRNHTPVDDRGHAWSSDGLPECLRLGARSFGWDERDPEPRSTRDGHWLIGTGMATAAYPIAFFMPEQRARARLHADGSAVVQMATVEFGTGALTMATQVAADALGLDADAVTFQAGDSDLPNASSTVGSAGAGMISSAVHAAGTALRDQLVAMAVGDPGLAAAWRRSGSVSVGGGRHDGARRERDLRGAARAQPHGRRGGDRLLAPAAVRRAVRAADVRRAVRRGRRRPRARARAGAPPGRRVRSGARPEPAARPQPADGRDAVGDEPGAARGQRHGPADRPLGGRQPGRVPRAGQRRRARRDDRVRRGLG